MSFSQKLASNVAPLVLRAALGIVFIWAGSGKVFFSMMVTPQQAATLANMGLLKPEQPPVSAAPSPAPAAAPAPGQGAEPESPAPTEPPPGNEAPTPSEEPAPDAPAAPQDETPQSGGMTPAQGGWLIAVLPAQAGGASAAGAYTEADFPGDTRISRVYGLVLLMHAAAQENEHGRVLWPRQLAQPRVLEALAWLASIGELASGIFLILGFLTRLWAMNLCATMCVAMWLTQIGPSIGNPDALLGFLPDPKMADPTWVANWNTLMLQLILLGSAAALVLTGPGRISLDGVLFGGGKSSRKKPVPPSPSQQ